MVLPPYAVLGLEMGGRRERGGASVDGAPTCHRPDTARAPTHVPTYLRPMPPPRKGCRAAPPVVAEDAPAVRRPAAAPLPPPAIRRAAVRTAVVAKAVAVRIFCGCAGLSGDVGH